MTVKKSTHAENCPFQGLIYANQNQGQSSMSPQLETRVGRIEGVVDTLTKDVQQVVKVVNEMSLGFNDFKENVSGRIIQANRPQWPLIVSVASLLLTLVVMGGSLIAFVMSGQADSLRENKSAIITINDKLYIAQLERGQFENWKVEAKEDFKTIYDTLNDVKLWKIEHIKEDGKQLASIQTDLNTLKQLIQKIEDRQYMNTGEVNKITVHHEKEQKDIDRIEARQYDDRINRLRTIEQKQDK